MNNSGKQTVTLNINAELIRTAQRRNIDLSETLETHLCQTLGLTDGPDFCESYAQEISSRSQETEALKQYCKSNGTF